MTRFVLAGAAVGVTGALLHLSIAPIVIAAVIAGVIVTLARR